MTGNLAYSRQNCELLPVIATCDRVVQMLRDDIKKSNFTDLSEGLGEVKNRLFLRGIETETFQLDYSGLYYANHITVR